MYSNHVLRQLRCYQCTHCIGSKEMKRGQFQKRLCDITNKWGNMEMAFYCTEFDNKREESSSYEYNGYRVKKDQIEDYRTKNQWEDAGYKIREGASGVEMYATRMAAMHNGKRFIYYLPEDVVKP